MSSEEEYSSEEEEQEETAAPPAAAEEAAAPAAEEAKPEQEEEEEEEEEEEDKSEAPPADEAAPPAEEDKPKRREAPPQQEVDPESLSEAERAMLEAKKRHEEQEARKLMDSDARRKLEYQQIEEEIVRLKQKKEERMREREEEERKYAELRKAADERKRLEEEERKAKMEHDRQRKEERRQREKELMSGAILGGFATEGAPADGAQKRNFAIIKKEPGEAEQAAAEKKSGISPEQREENKKAFISMVCRRPNVEDMLPNDLKDAIKKLHQRILRLEGEKYDLEKRHDRQDYDLKELGERQKQVARNKALDRGLDVDEAINSVHPPKITVASKFDRQIDRRSYGDRKDLFENPFMPPTPKIAHGTARPPAEWGRKKGTGVMDEIETIRKNLEPPKYVEQAPIEGAKPPVEPIPLQIPEGDEPEPEPAAAPPAAEPEAVEAEA